MLDPRNAPATVRRPAVDLIDAVLANMRNYREPLKYSVVAPSRYTVYVHPDEIVRLNGIYCCCASRPSGRCRRKWRSSIAARLRGWPA